MIQKKVVKNKAGEIVLKDATIQTIDDKILTVKLKNDACAFFIESKDVNINIWFAHDHGIHITAYQDGNETEIKELIFESVTKNKKIKIKLNKLLDGVEIKNR